MNVRATRHVIETTVRITHTDAAGVVYFARVLDLAHIAYEEAMDAVGHPLAAVIAEGRHGYPIVHAEADYRRPMRLGDRLSIAVEVAEVTQRSFRLAYEVSVLGEQTAVAANASTVHASIDARTGRAADLPEALTEALEAIRAPDTRSR